MREDEAQMAWSRLLSRAVDRLVTRARMTAEELAIMDADTYEERVEAIGKYRQQVLRQVGDVVWGHLAHGMTHSWPRDSECHCKACKTREVVLTMMEME